MRRAGWRSPLPDALDTDASTSLVTITTRAPSSVATIDTGALVAWSSERAAFRTVEFLTANIRNRHTRRAYQAAVRRFLAWCKGKNLTLPELRSPHVAEYIEELSLTRTSRPRSSTTAPATGSERPK